MKTKFILPILCLIPMVANASSVYRTEVVNTSVTYNPSGIDDNALARVRRFYVGGMFNWAMWQDFTSENNIEILGENTPSYEGFVGLRLYDTFRMELNYVHTDAQWDGLTLTGDSAMINAIWDARIDNIYRAVRPQIIVPYVGFGAGLSWNMKDDNAELDKRFSPVAAALAGISLEFNSVFALDLGYRYLYMFEPGVSTIEKFNPTAHQFRAGVRISF
ncbi:MAG: outer membrane beta-barrel protein [Alphaproteobacteria bacterium]|nr:outer membrane beta-barrel protein [Alphaproteobacteria bacterium]